MRSIFTTCFAFLVPYMALAEEPVSTHPVVIELYTSQGCSSCPAADKVVGGYADSKNILPLSFHISYWNSLGWEDPYSKEGFTKRQHEYKGYLSRFNVYTPQAVVQGRYDIEGYKADRIERGIKKSAVSKPWVDISLKLEGDKVAISIPAKTVHNARLTLIGYQHVTKNAVPRGENAGRTLSHRNTVLELLHIATYNGDAMDITYTKPAGDGVAVLLQTIDDGRIVGAAWL